MARPQAGEQPVHFDTYISLAEGDEVADLINKYSEELNTFYTSLPEEKADYAYAPGKWSLKNVLQHVMDTERVFAYRLMCISRKDKTPMPSFDENLYAENSFAPDRSFASLKEEFSAVRKSTDLLIKSLNEEQLSAIGISSTYPAKANSFCYIIFGHLIHHRNITQARYL